MNPQLKLTSNVQVPITKNVSVQSHCSDNVTIPGESLCPSENAIVLKTVKGLKQDDYMQSLLDIVEPKSVKFISYISRGRFCVHLSNKIEVDRLIDEHPFVSIGDHEIPIKRLLEPSKRVIVSNVFPAIPNEAIENALKRLGVGIVTPVQCLKASLRDPRLAHVLSHRRQLFINPEHSNKLPSSLVIRVKELSWKIYLTTERISCFICKGNHLAAVCPVQHKVNIEISEPDHINVDGRIKIAHKRCTKFTEITKETNNIRAHSKSDEPEPTDPEVDLLKINEENAPIVEEGTTVRWNSFDVSPSEGSDELSDMDLDLKLTKLLQKSAARLQLIESLEASKSPSTDSDVHLDPPPLEDISPGCAAANTEAKKAGAPKGNPKDKKVKKAEGLRRKGRTTPKSERTHARIKNKEEEHKILTK